MHWRHGKIFDLPWLASRLIGERMNPLIPDPSRFLIAVTERNEKIACGQIRPVEDSKYELASLFVEPAYRQKGIGSQTVEKLMTRHQSTESAGKDVYLLTLNRTHRFYEKLGFRIIEVNLAPSMMQAEYSIGKQIAAISANDSLVVMKFDP
eukprot:CAMPEP_0184489936 /NCGR_PEP_ID=MMETSP0113_2-20130426/16690_1 /TAXON_ID=91329 /ORGANISM="Norrisiella sphaerica, Strain BC52" /LENGTH=150 /DNA_ID=CAMNT_0026873607 /DNA_START=350 /DNA_END=802 /DNA_ORIENTATION=-